MNDISDEFGIPAHEGESSISILDNLSMYQLSETDRVKGDGEKLMVPIFRIEDLDWEAILIASPYDPEVTLVDEGEAKKFSDLDELASHLVQVEDARPIVERVIEKIRVCIEKCNM